MAKFDEVLLIDDDPISIIVYKKLIELTSFATNVSICKNGRSAFDLLTTLKDSFLIPQIIFLDIAMPGMNAWDFLEEIEKVKSTFKLIPRIYMLSSSIDPDDFQKAKSFSLVNSFISKPLTAEVLNKINRVNSITV